MTRCGERKIPTVKWGVNSSVMGREFEVGLSSLMVTFHPTSMILCVIKRIEFSPTRAGTRLLSDNVERTPDHNNMPLVPS